MFFLRRYDFSFKISANLSHLSLQTFNGYKKKKREKIRMQLLSRFLGKHFNILMSLLFIYFGPSNWIWYTVSVFHTI